MEIKWTKEQEEAVYAPVSDILVTAAAGAGKTQVLTGRILQRILGGADVTRMLVVTFTNAAATEMKGRIAKALNEELIKHPDNAHIRKQLMLLPAASIQTVHSFCLDTIKNNFFKADISPDFKIIEPAEEKIMCAEAMDEAMSCLYDEEDSDFLAFCDSFSTARSDEKSEEMIMALYRFASSMPFPVKWLCEQAEIYKNTTEDNFDSSYFAMVIREYVKASLSELKYEVLDMSTLCTGNLDAYRKMLEGDAEKIDALACFKGDWDEFKEECENFSFDRRPSIKDTSDEELKKKIEKFRDGVKRKLGSILSFMAHTRKQNVYLINESSAAVSGLVKGVLKFTEILDKMKKEKNVLSFGDIEHICIKLLSMEEIAEDRRNFFEEIYVDEYQDTNLLQDFIFRAVSRESRGEPNIFMVGDVKQSIYGFRNTSPELFMDKKEKYKFGDEKYRKIVLGKNFRSSKNVINFINTVFEKVMSKKTGGVEYNDEEKLIFAAPYPEKEEFMEINVLNSESGENDDDKSINEALFIAKRIQSLMDGGKVFDPKRWEERDMKYSDIAVLIRSPKSCIAAFEEVFKQNGIPAFIDYDAGYFDSAEIRCTLSLLSVIDNPLNDIPLIGTLRSPIGGFDENELAYIRTLCKGNFYNALSMCTKEDSKLGKKCLAFTDKIKKLRECARYMPCHHLVEKALSETGYYDVIYTMPDSAQRRENIELLIETARSYENSSYRGLYNFISYINNVKEKSGDFSDSKSLNEAHNVVRLMSIHKSKGLEFPVVFLARCGKKINLRDLSADAVFQSDCGIGINFFDTERRIKYTTPLREAAKIRKKQEDLSEEIRVLYVALTRAKEKIIVTASVLNAEDEKKKWKSLGKLFENGFFTTRERYIDYLMGVYYYCLNKGIKGISLKTGVHGDDLDTAQKKLKFTFSEKTDEKITAALGFEYGYDHLWEIPTKVTVSELKRLGDSDEEIRIFKNVDIKTPAFLEKEGLSPTQKGQLMHFVMQNIPVDTENAEQVKKFVEGLCEKKIISEDDAKAVDCEKIAAFFTSPLGKRLKGADKVFREEPFALSVPASKVTGDENDFLQTVMVQGIIDCYFFEGDNIVLLDYKTDRNTSEANIKKNYQKQIDLYAEALEKKHFKKIYEKFIYLFDNGGIISM